MDLSMKQEMTFIRLPRFETAVETFAFYSVATAAPRGQNLLAHGRTGLAASQAPGNNTVLKLPTGVTKRGAFREEESCTGIA
jgi:hypothetical protein